MVGRKSERKDVYTPAAAALSRSIPPQCCKFQPIKKCTTRTCNWRSEPSPKEIRRKSGITKFRWNCLVSEEKLPSVTGLSRT